MVDPQICTFCRKQPAAKTYKFTSLTTRKEVKIKLCDTCYQVTQQKPKK